FISHLKRIYDEWRFLVHQFVGPNKGYLENLDEKGYQELLKKMENDTRFSYEFKRYKPARDKIVNFLLQVTAMPDRYCVGKTASNGIKAMELSTAIQHAALGREGAIRCSDSEVINILKENGIDLIQELGNSFETYRFS